LGKKHTLKEQFSNLYFAYRLIWKANKKIYFFQIPIMVVRAVKTIVPIFFIRLILNEITYEKRIKYVLMYSILMALLSFVFNIAELVLSRYDEVEYKKMDFALQKLLAKSVSNMSYATLDDPLMHDFIWLVQDNRFGSVFSMSTNIVGSFLTLIGIGAVVISLNPLILVIIVISSIIRYLNECYLQRISYNYGEDRVRKSRENRYFMSLMNDVQMGKEIRMNGLENMIFEMSEVSWKNDLYKIDKKYTEDTLKRQSFNSIISVIQNIAIYAVLVLEVIYGKMTVGDFSMYLTAANTFTSCIIGISSNWSTLMFQTSWYLHDFRRCLEYGENTNKIDGEKHILKDERVEIEFRNVSFKYPRTERMILKNINLTIKQGETLSIVGVNGAGKSTFVRLLCRFYEPTEGEILVNGIPVKDIPLNEYYRLISVVFQDFSLFSFSLAENISMDIEFDEQKLIKSINKSGLNSRVEKLPKGVNTYIYKDFDPEGIELSGGEGQKVAIARAIYRDAPIIIFDEPTSSLDPIAEYNLYRNFHSLANGKTAIYISHRLSSTRFTDRIAVFSNGTICEYGTHTELMQIEEGIYQKMFSLQENYYK